LSDVDATILSLENKH